MLTAIELMDELAAQLRSEGDHEQAAFLQGACDALYAGGGEPPDTEDARVLEAYNAGFQAAVVTDYGV